MKSIPLLIAAASAALLAGCSSGPSKQHEHWSANSVGPRVGYYLTGYDSEVDGEYVEYQWRKKQNIRRTLRRHLLNDNPENPFTMPAEAPNTSRPLHSPLPNPFNYFGVEALVFGGITYAAGGTFIPIPVDSLIATFSPGGGREFVEGIQETAEPAGILLLTVLPGESYETDAVITGWSTPAGH